MYVMIMISNKVSKSETLGSVTDLTTFLRVGNLKNTTDKWKQKKKGWTIVPKIANTPYPK